MNFRVGHQCFNLKYAILAFNNVSGKVMPLNWSNQCLHLEFAYSKPLNQFTEESLIYYEKITNEKSRGYIFCAK